MFHFHILWLTLRIMQRAWLLALWLAISVSTLSRGAQAACDASRWDERLDIDFETFDNGIHRDALDRAESRTHGGYRVLLINNTVHAIPLGWEAEPDRLQAGPHEIFGLLQRALCVHAMPDVEFVLNIYDRRASIVEDDPVPLLSWSKDAYPFGDDLLYPYWQLAYVNASVQALHADAHPWHTRRPQAFFRGATTGGVFKPVGWRAMLRVRLVAACKKLTRLCDAGLTTYVQAFDGVEAAMRTELGSWPKTAHDEVSK